MNANGKGAVDGSHSHGSSSKSTENAGKLEPGEGIRSLKTSTAFRMLNFELYAKPNKFTMAVGLVGITISIGYLIYMNTCYDKSKYYVATQEDGTAVLQPRRSRWDA